MRRQRRIALPGACEHDIEVITVEHNYCERDQHESNQLLTANGFVRLFQELSKFNDWYVKRAIMGR